GTALPTGISANTWYFVSTANLLTNTFQISDTEAHALAGTNHINTSSTGTAVTIISEVWLSSPNVAGRYTLYLGRQNMQANDLIVVRTYMKDIAGGTVLLYDQQPISDAPITGESGVALAIDECEAVSTALAEINALRFSLEQRLGTARAFTWRLEKI